MKNPRIILVEDDAFTRTTIKAALQLQGVEVILDTSNVASAMKIARTSRPDAAVLDLDLGKGPNGIDLAIGLRNQDPHIGIVLLTGFVDPRLLNPRVGKLPEGSKYLIKSQVHEIEILRTKIIESIDEARANFRKLTKERFKGLDIPDAQIETLRLIANGLPNDEIAKARGISEKSVEQAISRLVSHFELQGENLNKRVELTRIYFNYSGSVPAHKVREEI